MDGQHTASIAVLTVEALDAVGGALAARFGFRP